MLYGRTGGDTCGNSKDRRHAADTADGHHEKDAADLTDGRLGGRVTRKEIYETELPHRAVAVYLYLETRADRERTLDGITRESVESTLANSGSGFVKKSIDVSI